VSRLQSCCCTNPSRNLLLREIDDNEIETVVYEPISSAADSDDDVKVSSIQLGVVRCSHTTVKDEDWRRFSVFHTYITHEGKNYKLMIDDGSCANIMPRQLLRRVLKLNHIPPIQCELG